VVVVRVRVDALEIWSEAQLDGLELGQLGEDPVRARLADDLSRRRPGRERSRPWRPSTSKPARQSPTMRLKPLESSSIAHAIARPGTASTAHVIAHVTYVFQDQESRAQNKKPPQMARPILERTARRALHFRTSSAR
jgi:hypothetical protein